MESIIQVQQGERFSFDIRTTSGESVRFAGEVAYVFEGMGFGVRFVDVNDESKEFLEKIIEEKS